MDQPLLSQLLLLFLQLFSGPSRDGPGPRAETVMGPHCRRPQKPFLGYALSNAVRWTVKGMNFEINAPETLEFQWRRQEFLLGEHRKSGSGAEPQKILL